MSGCQKITDFEGPGGTRGLPGVPRGTPLWKLRRGLHLVGRVGEVQLRSLGQRPQGGARRRGPPGPRYGDLATAGYGNTRLEKENPDIVIETCKGHWNNFWWAHPRLYRSRIFKLNCKQSLQIMKYNEIHANGYFATYFDICSRPYHAKLRYSFNPKR